MNYSSSQTSICRTWEGHKNTCREQAHVWKEPGSQDLSCFLRVFSQAFRLLLIQPDYRHPLGNPILILSYLCNLFLIHSRVKPGAGVMAFGRGAGEELSFFKRDWPLGFVQAPVRIWTAQIWLVFPPLFFFFV